TFGFIRGVQSIGGVGQGLDAAEAGCAVETCRIESESLEVALGSHEGFQQDGDVIFDRGDNSTASAAALAVFVTKGVLGESLAQTLEHAVVVHNDPLGLAGKDAVGPGDG